MLKIIFFSWFTTVKGGGELAEQGVREASAAALALDHWQWHNDPIDPDTNITAMLLKQMVTVHVQLAEQKLRGRN